VAISTHATLCRILFIVSGTSIDIDGFDPSIAPGTGTPSHGGFQYYEVLEILQGIARQAHVVGMDPVEVAPPTTPVESPASWLRNCC
jgi:arginase family enzyme